MRKKSEEGGVEGEARLILVMGVCLLGCFARQLSLGALNLAEFRSPLSISS